MDITWSRSLVRALPYDALVEHLFEFLEEASAAIDLDQDRSLYFLNLAELFNAEINRRKDECKSQQNSASPVSSSTAGSTWA